MWYNINIVLLCVIMFLFFAPTGECYQSMYDRYIPGGRLAEIFESTSPSSWVPALTGYKKVFQ